MNTEEQASRITQVEKDTASMKSDIRGIYSTMGEIKNAFVKFQDNSKPDIRGLFISILATCTFLVTIGGLAMAPMYNNQAKVEAATLSLSDKVYDINDRLARLEGPLTRRTE